MVAEFVDCGPPPLVSAVHPLTEGHRLAHPDAARTFRPLGGDEEHERVECVAQPAAAGVVGHRDRPGARGVDVPPDALARRLPRGTRGVDGAGVREHRDQYRGGQVEDPPPAERVRGVIADVDLHGGGVGHHPAARGPLAVEVLVHGPVAGLVEDADGVAHVHGPALGPQAESRQSLLEHGGIGVHGADRVRDGWLRGRGPFDLAARLHGDMSCPGQRGVGQRQQLAQVGAGQRVRHWMDGPLGLESQQVVLGRGEHGVRDLTQLLVRDRAVCCRHGRLLSGCVAEMRCAVRLTPAAASAVTA